MRQDKAVSSALTIFDLLETVMENLRLLVTAYVGVFVMSGAAIVLASESVPTSNPSFDSVQFERDVKNTVTAATRLNALCTTEKNQSYCDQAESIMRVLREYAETNPSGLKASDDNAKYLNLINPAYLDSVEKAFSTSSQ